MLVRWMLENNILIIIAIIFAVQQMCLIIRYKPFQKNADAKCINKYRIHTYVFIAAFWFILFADIVYCFLEFVKVLV